MLGPLKNEIPPQVRKANQAMIEGRSHLRPRCRGGGKRDQR
jgi:hypothetical protein